MKHTYTQEHGPDYPGLCGSRTLVISAHFNHAWKITIKSKVPEAASKVGQSPPPVSSVVATYLSSRLALLLHPHSPNLTHCFCSAVVR